MKNIFFLLSLSFVFFSCQKTESPASPSDQTASGNLFFSFDKANAPASVQTLTTTLSRSGFVSLVKTININSDTVAALVFENVAIGIWNVKVDAKDESGTVLFTGQSEVVVLENTVSQVNLVLTPVSSGVGSVQINVSWGTGGPSTFSKTYGGTQRDVSICVIQTKDGGYAVGGMSFSLGSGGDAWLVKTDAKGVLQWKKNYGTDGEDRINNILQTDDGGYLFVGYKHYNGEDSWIVRLDSVGNILWEKNFGASGDDAFLILKRMSDGSYLTCGYIYKDGFFDGRLVRFTPTGEMLWSKNYGAGGGDFTMRFVEMENNDILVAGTNGSDFSKHYDFWFFKIDGNGNLLWEKTYGDNSEERCVGCVELSNGTYLLNGMKVTNGSQDLYFMNVDSTGSVLWTKTYDAGSVDILIRLQRAADNSIIGSGYTSTTGKGYQGLLMKLDNAGNAAWIKTYGGNGYDVFSDFGFTKDGKIIVAGSSSSSGSGQEDYWLSKYDMNGVIQ